MPIPVASVHPATRVDPLSPAVRASHSWLADCVPLALILAVWLLAPGAGRPLANPDEGRYAEIPRAMAASGDWVTPRLNGVKYFEKPPLMYWVEAAVVKFAGSDERLLRAPVALFAFAGCLLVYFGTRACFGRRPARNAALVLATSLFFWAMAVLLTLDMAVSVLMSATLLCFIVGCLQPAGPRRRGWFYGLYACAALATLTKGLIGFLVPGAIICLWALVYRQWRRLRPLYLPTGTALFLAIAAPWHVLVALRNPEWMRFYFVHEHWLRFTTTTHGRTEPWWFFLPVIGLGFFPWLGFLLPALGAALKRSGKDATEHATTGFFVIWALFIIVFFSLSGSKLIPYVLPAVPPLAILTGCWLARERPVDAVAYRWAWGSFIVAGLVLAAAVGTIALKPSLLRGAELEGARLWLGIAVIGVVAGLAAVGRYAWQDSHRKARAAVLGTAVFFYVGALGPLSARTDIRSSKELARIIVREGGMHDAIFHYRDFFQDFLYYTGRPVQLVDTTSELEVGLDASAREGGVCLTSEEFYLRWKAPERAWALLRRRRLAALQAEPGFSYHLCGETPSILLVCNQATPEDIHERTP